MKYVKLILVIIFSIIIYQLVGIQNSWSQDHGLGNILIDSNVYNQNLRSRPKNFILSTIPNSYDARDYNIVTPAKDQGTCGSCWAFASIGALESHLLKDGYLFYPEDLSEQQLLSCNYFGYSCYGGSSLAIKHWMTNGPIYEDCYLYSATEVSCYPSYSCTGLGYRIYDWHTVNKSIYDFKYSLYYYGPSYWYFDVYGDFYTFWKTYNVGNVYINKSDNYIGSHAVLIIGWNDDKEAFLCKNSWGSSKGPNGDGTFWISYDGHSNDLNFGMINFRVKSVGCTTNSECDDREFCNGVETCVGGSCQNDSQPCYDDGEYCNGDEYCNETLDICLSTGEPCISYYSICNETTDECDNIQCFDNSDCNDGEPLTIDTCYENGTAYSYCENIWSKKEDKENEKYEKILLEKFGCFIFSI